MYFIFHTVFEKQFWPTTSLSNLHTVDETITTVVAVLCLELYEKNFLYKTAIWIARKFVFIVKDAHFGQLVFPA